MRALIILRSLLLLNISNTLVLAKSLNSTISSYPDGPQGPDFAKKPGAMKVDLLEGGIEKHWNIEVHDRGYVNNEVQAYTRDAIKQDKSTKSITITAHKSGSYVTSGRINTNHKWNSADSESTKRRGYLEVRAKFPAKTNGYNEFKGAWPAVWMLGTGNGGHWPGEGEIDIMESVNGDPEIHMSLHSTNHHGGNAQHPSGDVNPNADFSHDGAILGLEWNVLEQIGQIDITWWISYFDLGSHSWRSEHHTKSLYHGRGQDYHEFYNSFVNANGFYAIINLAEGGDWPNCHHDYCVLTNGDQYLIVDSAKVYGV